MYPHLRKRFASWLCLGMACTGLLHAQQSEKADREIASQNASEVPRQIQVQAEFIELSQEQYSALMLDRKATADATPLRKELQELIKQKKAKILESMLVTSPDNLEARTESNSEYIYPSDYKVMKREEKDGVSSAYPVSFENLRLGNSFDVLPKIERGYVNLNIHAELVSLVAGSAKSSTTVPLNKEGELVIPKTVTLRFSQALVVQNGKYLLAATISPEDEDDNIDATRKVMVFVKADLLK